MNTTQVTVIWLLLMAVMSVIIYSSSALPQSYEHNYVRIHVPVIKHTRHHTRTLVKKIPVPVPIPVPIHDHDNDDDHEEHGSRWFDDKTSFSSFKSRPKKNRNKEYEDSFSSFE